MKFRKDKKIGKENDLINQKNKNNNPENIYVKCSDKGNFVSLFANSSTEPIRKSLDTPPIHENFMQQMQQREN